MSLMSTSDLFRHLYRTRDAAIHRKAEWQWCPNPRCGRMACVVAGTGSVAVNCVCGWLWCSLCMQEVHWPATCKQAAGYRELVKNISKFEQTNIEIPSKGLPKDLSSCILDEYITFWVAKSKIKGLNRYMF